MMIVNRTKELSTLRLLVLIALLLLVSNENVAFAFVPQSISLLNDRTQSRRSFIPLAATKPKKDESFSAAAETSNEPDMKAFANGFKTVFDEVAFRKCTPSYGSIPDDLRGSYFRAGPAMFSAGSIVPPKTSIVQPRQPPVPDGQDPDRMVHHPFEGDGAVLGITFHGSAEGGEEDNSSGFVSARFRYVRTIAFTNERKKGARVYKSMDSTRDLGQGLAEGLGNDWPLPLHRHHLQLGLNKNRKNTSNSRAVYFGKRLLTMWEGGQPFKLDGLSLQTEGRSRLGGAIKRDEDPFGGKMAYDSKKNRAVFYGLDPNPLESEITLYEFNPDFRLVTERGGRFSKKVPGFSVISDFCVTENFAAFVLPNIAANGMQFLVNKEPGKIINLANEKDASAPSAYITLIPRAGSRQEDIIRIPVPNDDGISNANLQFINAYEDGDRVVIDAIRSDGSKKATKKSASTKWPWATTLDSYQSLASKKTLWRYIVETKSRKVTKECLSTLHGFFGTINPSVSAQKHRYIYMNIGRLGDAVAPPQGISKLNVETGEMETWMPEGHEFCGEPIFADRPSGSGQDGEDNGYILSVLFNGKSEESELVVLDARNIPSGPLARIPLGIAVPHGLFGCFTSGEEARWEPDVIQRRAKLADKMEGRGNMWNEVKSDFSGLGLRLDDMEEYFGDFFS